MADNSNPFAAPTKLSNVVLIVDGKKLHVSKEYLAAHSDFFYALFFEDFAEKGKDEVEIKDVVFEEFVDLLNVIHPNRTPITEISVSHILKLADRFQMKDTLEQSQSFLLNAISFDMTKKLIIADQYNLHKFKSSSEYGNLSDAMKAAICDRMMELMREESELSYERGCNCNICGTSLSNRSERGHCLPRVRNRHY